MDVFNYYKIIKPAELCYADAANRADMPVSQLHAHDTMQHLTGHGHAANISKYDACVLSCCAGHN